jgi:hypothetical protein
MVEQPAAATAASAVATAPSTAPVFTVPPGRADIVPGGAVAGEAAIAARV